jgi:hypothetical protein
MPWEKPIYGIIIFDDDSIGMWKTAADHKIELNIEPQHMNKILGLAEDNGAVLSFLIDPEMEKR